MHCRKCDQEIPDLSPFCNRCGSPQQDAPAPLPTLPSPSSPPPPEQEVWKGRISAWSFAHWWLLYVLQLVGQAYLHLSGFFPLEGWMAYAHAVLAAAIPAWVFWKTLAAKLTVRYRLTTHRFFKEVGLLHRKVNELELVRVDDVSVSQNLLQRIFDVGRVTVFSNDATDPRLEIEGVEHPIELKEMIRKNARTWRDRALHMESI